MANLSFRDKDILQFGIRLAVILVLAFFFELLSFNTLSVLLSIGGHAYLLFFAFNLSQELTSNFPRLLLVAVLLSLLAEISMLFNVNLSERNFAFWLFIICHFTKNAVLSGKFITNVTNSEIYNYFWVKFMPFPCVGMLFILLEVFVFSKEKDQSFIFFLYNLVASLSLLTASLRHNHTSYRGYFLMVLGILCLVVSDIFFFLNDIKVSEGQEMSIQFRVTFLILGNTLILVAAYDHVIEFEREFRKKIYFNTEEGGEMSRVKGKHVKAISRAIEEPLI